MRNIRYSLLLPVLHLLVALPLIYHREAQTWQYIPRIQRLRDEYLAHPLPKENFNVSFDPCYEHRLSTEERFLYIVELPVGLLIGPDGTSDSCDFGALSRILHILGNNMSVKAGWIFTDCMLVIGIWIQWYLIGYRLVFLQNASKPILRWAIPAFAITACGVAMALGELCGINLRDVVVLTASLLALLGWCALLPMITILTFKKVLHLARAFF